MVDIYNPNSPRITGLEWVPIREVGVQMSRYDTPVELGYTFSLPAPAQASRAFFYIKDYPEDFILFQPYTVNIYPQGAEADVGPIQRVVAKVAETSSITNTGTVSASAGVRLINTGSISQALQDPSGDQFMNMATGGNGDFLVKIRFNMTPLASVLTGKRIVAVNLLTALAGSPGVIVTTAGRPDLSPNLTIYVGDNGTGTTNDGWDLNNLRPELWKGGVVNTGSLGDTNFDFNSNDMMDTVNVANWSPVQLARFGSVGVDQLYIGMENIFVTADAVDTWQFTYFGLEILFCEERRVATGTRMFGPFFTGHYTVPSATSGRNVHLLWYNMNANQVQLYNPQGGYTTNPILPAGDYTMTLAQANVGAAFIQDKFAVPPPTLQACRQLYEIPNLQGVQINHPIPTDDRIVGKTFTKQLTDIIPQMSLWASGAAASALVTNMHVYGRQTVAQVSTSNATQGIVNSGSTAFDYVRFYARRWGHTPAPLVLTTPTLTTGSTAAVFITPDEWDALDPIVDNWKEVTLPFATPVTISGGAGTFQWSSSTTPLGSRWEVLGASALALSGAPDNDYVAYPTLVPNANTYGGTTAQEAWVPGFPPGILIVSDPSADAVLMLASKYTAPTLALSQLNQPVSGIGQNCGLDPAGIPTAIAYNQLSWAQSNSMEIDNFTRVAAGSWGGQWNIFAGTATPSVDGSRGVITSITTTRAIEAISTISYTDVEVRSIINIPSFTTSAVAGVITRSSGSTDYYSHELQVDFTNKISLVHNVVVAGSLTTLATQILPYRWSATASFNIRAQVQGTFLRTKIWPVEDDEPDFWQLVTADSTRTSGGVGVITRSVSVTNFDDFVAQPFNTVGSTYQLERMDTVDTDWKIIMKATNMATLLFNDYEARIGVLTSYRMRILDQYDFEGDYSSTVTNTITAPGVSGTKVGATGEHIMVFTSNERQDGSINLAYSNAWSNDVSEPFNFPEAGFNQLQAMYNKDFFTAFRPLERGGEQFSRSLLVQAAAVAVPTLPDFTSLRDMAWDSVSYICVRDEDGNRWFANIQVPTGTVTHKRELYIATVSITEVTDTPAQVDP